MVPVERLVRPRIWAVTYDDLIEHCQRRLGKARLADGPGFLLPAAGRVPRGMETLRVGAARDELAGGCAAGAKREQ